MRVADFSDLATGAVTIVFALLTLFVLIPVGVEDPGSINVLALGPSFWPSIIAVFMLMMGVILGIQGIRRHLANLVRAGGNGDDQRTLATAVSEYAFGRWLGSLVLLAVFYFLLDPLGMILASVFAMVALMLLGSERRPMILGFIAVGLPFALFLFFRYVANVSIPLGLLEPWLA